MFSCNLSMKAQAFSSPHIWIQALTISRPVPDEAGVELMQMIRKSQMNAANGSDLTFAEQFYSLAA